MMLTRNDIENLEVKNLAPYAMKSIDSAGREYNEPVHAIRTCYQRDRDRIIHSEAFRNLEYKTQVFVILEGDYYRTRLTHTIEVAQIARTIGRNLSLNEDLIEAIALAHDLGHAPFGHAGEEALKEIMQEANLQGFNHNFRSFEIVTKHEKRYPDFCGLNLTEEVLIGILKHETVYDQKSEVQAYRDKGPTLEAKVVDIADSIAYLSHDIDDGITSTCITIDDLKGSHLWQEALKMIQDKIGMEDKQMLKYQVVKSLIDIQSKDLLAFSDEQLRNQKFSSAEEVKAYHLISSNDPVIGFSPQMREQRDELQNLLDEKLYHHYRVIRMTEKAKRIINELFEVYRHNPKQLPYDVYQRDRDYSREETYEIICNFLASRTDRSALDEYKKLFDSHKKV